jgi:hypothetical protein
VPESISRHQVLSNGFSEPPTQVSGYASVDLQPEADDTTVDMPLYWSDSADLLSSILAAELTALPHLGVGPSQPSDSDVRGGRQDSLPYSLWLTAESGQQTSLHGGAHAVQNLSQIISSLVECSRYAQNTKKRR